MLASRSEAARPGVPWSVWRAGAGSPDSFQEKPALHVESRGTGLRETGSGLLRHEVACVQQKRARLFLDQTHCSSFCGRQTGWQDSLGAAACMSFVEKVVDLFLKLESAVSSREGRKHEMNT